MEQYPTEYVKTRSQFASQAGVKVRCSPSSSPVVADLHVLLQPPGPIEIVRTTLKRSGIAGLYSGCGALVAGNAVKAGVRFFSYDKFKKALVNSEVRPTLILTCGDSPDV